MASDPWGYAVAESGWRERNAWPMISQPAFGARMCAADPGWLGDIQFVTTNIQPESTAEVGRVLILGPRDTRRFDRRGLPVFRVRARGLPI